MDKENVKNKKKRKYNIKKRILKRKLDTLNAENERKFGERNWKIYQILRISKKLKKIITLTSLPLPKKSPPKQNKTKGRKKKREKNNEERNWCEKKKRKKLIKETETTRNVVRHFHNFGNWIRICRIMFHDTKILQNFWLTVV